MIDIDATWNPDECSLDEHRMKVLATIEQPGFGAQAKLPAFAPVPIDAVEPAVEVTTDGQ